MRLKYGAKYIFFMVSIACVSLVLINFVLKDNNDKIIEDKTSRIVIESPKKANIPEDKESVNDKGTRVSISSINERTASSVKPMPVPDSNAPIVITLLK